jgi:hypothetical protein
MSTIDTARDPRRGCPQLLTDKASPSDWLRGAVALLSADLLRHRRVVAVEALRFRGVT